MNRTDEYWALVNELSQPPAELAGSVDRARKRARRERFTKRLRNAAASLAGLAAAFVLLVNVFPTFALACSGLPIVRELAAAVAFSPSLSAAVAHDYVQYIGQSETVDGVTVKLEYAIVDRHQAVFFYSVEGEGRFNSFPSITDMNGEPVGSYGTSNSYALAQNGLETMTLSFSAGSKGLPDHFMMEMFFKAVPEQDQVSEPVAPANSSAEGEPEALDPREDPDTLHFFFEVSLDPDRIAEGRTIEVGQWAELDGQRIFVDRLELFPTRTILYLGEDEANTAWLKSLKFSFIDEKGSCYDDIDGVISATGTIDSQSFLTYYFQSFYYDLPKSLTLCINKAAWLEKDLPHVVLDLTTGEGTGLPDEVEVSEIWRQSSVTAPETEEDVFVTILSPRAHREFTQLFGNYYWDPEGGQHEFNRWSGGTEYRDGEEMTYEVLYLIDYPWDMVELELDRSGISEYEEPIMVPLF